MLRHKEYLGLYGHKERKFSPNESFDNEACIKRELLPYFDSAFLQCNELGERIDIELSEANELSENTVQKVYAQCLKNRLIRPLLSEGHKLTQSFQLLTRLKQFTGIEPSEGLVQKAYKEVSTKQGFINDLEKLIEFTGIEPLECTIQAEYENCVEEVSANSVKHIYELNKITGVELFLSEFAVQNIYKNIIEKALSEVMSIGAFRDRYLPSKYSIKLLEKLTGVKPSEDIIQKSYRDCINVGAIRKCVLLKDATGIKPLLPEELVQKGYAMWAKDPFYTYLAINNFKDIEELIGIKPPEEIIQEAYTKFRQEGKSMHFKKLCEITGVDPLI